MNIRLQKYKKNRLTGMSIYNAARAAGYSEAYARKALPEKVAKGSIQDALEREGITDKALAKHAIEGLNATKTVSAVIVGADATDKTDDFIDVPDWNARHKYFETILKLSGKLVNKVDVSGNINFTKMGEVVVIDAQSNNHSLEYSIGKSDN